MNLTAAWDWSKKWDFPVNPTKCNYLTIGRKARPPEIVFFSRWVGHPISVSKVAKELGVQTDLFSPSAQCTEAANKASRMIFMIRRFKVRATAEGGGRHFR